MAELGVWTIPGHVVHEQLEAGLVSATYLASRSSDGYPVLLDVMSEEFTDPLSVDLFRTAIDQISAIRHPVLPVVTEVGETDGLLYTISNAVEGRPLGATLRAQGTLPLDDTLAVCRELADALDMLASAGTVHAAISPSTVWINDRVRAPAAPYVSLRGFGTTPLRSHHVQEAGAAPPPDVLYTAPEQIRGSAPEPRTDQYALACMVLHCLTGAAPFDRPTIDALFDAHLTQEPDDGLLQADRLSLRVVTGLQRALAKDPADRFATCVEFCDAIGDTSRPSWDWMLEDDTRSAGATVHEIDIRDEVLRTGGDDVPAADREQHTAAPNAAGARTARSLSEVDWLPGSATRTGPQRPVRRPQSPAPAIGPNPVVAAPRRRISARQLRWVGATVLTLVVAAGAVVLARALLAVDPATVAVSSGGDVTPELTASWREPIAEGPITLLAATDDEVVSVADTTVDSLDSDTGRARWSTTLDAAVQDLSVLGPTIVVRTAAGFVGLERADGGERWRSGDTDMPDLDAFITGRGRMFGVGRDDAGDLVVHAIDPTTGETGWSIAAPADADADPAAPALIAFDGSEQGERSLYVAHDDQLYAFSVTTRELRWQQTLVNPHPSSLTALAGAVLVVGGDGEVCRYHARDGDTAWTTCAELERADAPAAITQVRDSRVVVGSEHEVASLDFTSGTAQWRIVSDQALQPVMAANRVAAYVVAPDGTVEAVALHNGASLWESAPFGPISAMAATDDAVFLTTADGRLTRLEAPEAPGSAG